MDNKQNPLEMPDNNPDKETKPITSKGKTKKKNKSNMVKFAYAFAVLIAIGGALAAKIATEKTLGNINTPIEQDYVTIPTTQSITVKDTEFEVRQNVTDVPDTREEVTETETEKSTEKETTQTTTQMPTETTTEGYAMPYKDYYTLPAGTDILKEYLPNTPMYNTTTDDWRTHPAVDFKSEEGAQIKAISAGVVKNIYDDVLLGTVMEIDHGNGVIAKYCGINKETLKRAKDNKVTAGQVIGYLGEVPFEKSEAPHLHFEIEYNGESVDPLELMGK